MQKQFLLILGILMIGLTAAQAELRLWTYKDKMVEAEYINIMGDRLVLRSASGKTIKIPMTDVSPEDREYLDLVNVPKFTVGFLKTGNQRFVETGPFIENVDASFTDYEFGARIALDDRRVYNYELKIEYWAIGAEVKTYGHKYILLDYGSSVYTPSAENKGAHAFTGNDVELMQHVYDGDKRGREYYGYIITLTDIRGEIILHQESNKWLWENLEKIRVLPKGAFMDKEGNRCHPTRPKSTRY